MNDVGDHRRYLSTQLLHILERDINDGRCVWALSGRLEDPVDDHCVRVRLPVGKHRALLFPQGVHRLHPEAKKLLAQNAPKVLSSTAKMLLPGKK